MELVFTSSETAAITIFCSFPGVTRRAIKYDNKQSDSSSAANAHCRAGERMGTHSREPCLDPLGDPAPWARTVPPAEPWGCCAAFHRAEALEVCGDGAARTLAPEQGDLAPLCPSRYGILFPWATPGDGNTPKLVPAPFTRTASTWVAPTPSLHRAGPRAISPEGGSKPGTRLQERILQPLCGTPWQAPLRAAQGPAVPKQSPSPSAAGSLPGGSCGPSSTARHQAVPTAIELRRWVGWGPSGNETKITGDLESLPVGAPRAGGRGHWALVATEHSAHDGVFGSHSILCLFHSSPSSFSPFKALRLCRTETISWPGPRTWLLRSALSWALSGCQPWQETFFAIPP